MKVKYLVNCYFGSELKFKNYCYNLDEIIEVVVNNVKTSDTFNDMLKPEDVYNLSLDGKTGFKIDNSTVVDNEDAFKKSLKNFISSRFSSPIKLYKDTVKTFKFSVVKNNKDKNIELFSNYFDSIKNGISFMICVMLVEE